MREAIADVHPLPTTQDAASTSEVEQIRPELRTRLAHLEAKGLLAAGVRTILQENGYGPDLLRKHCGCHSCAQRCSVCAQRYHGQE